MKERSGLKKLTFGVAVMSVSVMLSKICGMCFKIPLTAILVPGVLNIKGGPDGDRQAAMHSGFVEIMQDHVTILAESCEWPEEIDLNRAKEAQIRAERRLKSGDSDVNMTRAELALRRSLIRIELA